MSTPESQRILPHMDISEQALRELEIWLLGRLGRGGLQYHRGVYGPKNVGDWLYIEATGGSATTHTEGIYFVAPHGVRFDSGLMAWNLTDLWSLDMTDGHGINWNIGATSNFLYNGGDVSFTGNATAFDVTTKGGDIRLLNQKSPYLADLQLNSNGTTLLHCSNQMEFRLDSAQNLVVTDANIAPVLTVNEDSTTTHKLGNGKTFVINDHLGSPLVTYTG